jgi:hypothetical protein
MEAIADQLLDTAACSRRFLEKDSRAEVARFILGQQNSDGGFRGRGSASDLYYSVFAAAGLKALGRRIPVFSLWNYVRSFGMGEDLDLVHLVSLIRLRTAFPTPGKTRRRFFQILEAHRTDSAYDLFLKLLIGEHADEPVEVPLTAPTTNLAAAVVVNRQTDKATEAALSLPCVYWSPISHPCAGPVWNILNRFGATAAALPGMRRMNLRMWNTPSTPSLG